jgi:hypothetical protein
MAYTFTNVINSPTPIGGNLNGKHINLDSLPESIQILISNPKYVVLVRETTTTTSNGGRTTDTLWYNKQILGFAVEDAIRSKKIAKKTAIPDTIGDASKFNGIPSNVYNIVLSTYTKSDFIRKSFYNGKGMRVSSKGDPSGMNIYESDVFTSDNFATDRGKIAFDGVFIHQGDSENSSAGCIIFSRTKNSDGTVKSDVNGVQQLNKYLQSIGLIGKGKLQQLAIINLWEFPEPPVKTNTSGTVINSETNQLIKGITIKETTPNLPTPTPISIPTPIPTPINPTGSSIPISINPTGSSIPTPINSTGTPTNIIEEF